MALAGQFPEALRRIDQALITGRELLGANNLRVLLAQHYRANILKFLGRNNEALAEIEAFLPIRVEVLGPRHPNVLSTRYLRADVLNSHHLVSATSHELANGVLTNSNAPRYLTVGTSLEDEILDQLPSRARHSRTSTRVTGGPAQRRQSSILEASLVSSHSACGTAKSSGYIGLIRQALVHKVHHGIGLGHVIAQCVLCQHDPGGNHHSMAILGPHQAPIVNRAGAFGGASVLQDAGTGTRAPFVV